MHCRMMWMWLFVCLVLCACVAGPAGAADDAAAATSAARDQQQEKDHYDTSVKDDLDPEPFVKSRGARETVFVDSERGKKASEIEREKQLKKKEDSYIKAVADLEALMNTDSAEAKAMIRQADELLAANDLYGRVQLLKKVYEEHRSPEAAFLIGQHLLFDQANGLMSVVEQAFGYLNASANAGHAGAQHLLSFLYATGIGVEQHAGLAVTYDYFAAAGGSARASMAMGYRHLHGLDVPKSCSAARKYYTAAAEGVVELLKTDEKVDFNIDRVKLRAIYENGEVAERDSDVRQYYAHAARTGDAQAQLAMGQICFYGAKGQTQDYDRALKYFTAAHEQGVSRATEYLGRMHYHGWGVPEKDYKKAEAYFKQAEAKRGNGAVTALNGLGLMHLHGHGVPRNLAQAFKYFKASASHGLPEAQYHLALMYLRGISVAKQYPLAIKYFSMASQQGYTLAMHALALMYYNGQGTQASCEVGTNLMKTVAERGECAGDMTKARERYGDGMFTSSVMLYSLAAEEGFEVAQENAGWIFDVEHSALEFDPHKKLDTGVVAVPPLPEEQPQERADEEAASPEPKTAIQVKSVDDASDSGVHVYDSHKRLELAQRYYKLASGQGNAYASRQLGDYAYYGLLDDSPDYTTAVKHYLLAAERKDAQSSFNLGYMHEQGLGVSKDWHLSKRYYDEAVNLDASAQLPVQLALYKLQFDAFWMDVFGEGAARKVLEVDWSNVTLSSAMLAAWRWYLQSEDVLLWAVSLLFIMMIFSRSRNY